MSAAKELIALDEEKVLEVFSAKNGLEPIMQEVAKIVGDFEHDMSTAASRKKTIAMATKVASTKVKVDTLGKELVSGWKNQAKLVDANRKVFRDTLDALKIEARAPLVEWEAEQAELAELEYQRQEEEKNAREREQSHEMAMLMNEAWDREVADKVEAERLRKAEEQRLADEAFAKESERLAAEDIANAEREIAEAKERAKQAELDAITAKAEQKAAENQAELNRQQAIIDNAAAEKLAAENALEVERNRIAEVERKAEQDRKDREANNQHVGRVRKEAKEALMKVGLTEEMAKKVVLNIHHAKIPAVSIKY